MKIKKSPRRAGARSRRKDNYVAYIIHHMSGKSNRDFMGGETAW